MTRFTPTRACSGQSVQTQDPDSFDSIDVWANIGKWDLILSHPRKNPMFIRSILLTSALLLPQVSFANPVPQDKLHYVGEWIGKQMRLQIAKNGKIEYERNREGKSIDLNIELKGFNGDNFDAGVSVVRSTFVVSKPPHRDGADWKMVVDGVELTKVE